MKHTPGPWEVRLVDNWNRYEVVGDSPHVKGKSHQICLVNGHWDPKSHKANAHLISAAPDMLEALTRLRCEAVHFKTTGNGEKFLVEALHQANEAIRKAKGEA